MNAMAAVTRLAPMMATPMNVGRGCLAYSAKHSRSHFMAVLVGRSRASLLPPDVSHAIAGRDCPVRHPNLARAADALPFAKARAATIHRDLIAVAARTARHGRGHLTLHLPEGWRREHEWLNLLGAACGPPAAAA
jgi:hypothetical protein